MEKLIYLVWSDPARGGAVSLREALLGEVGRSLLDAGARGLSFVVGDPEAGALGGLRIAHDADPPDTVISLWLDTHLRREWVDRHLAARARRLHAYLALESVPLCRPPAPGPLRRRLPALVTVAFLRRPAGLPEEEWLARWQGRHTQVAIDTQSTFLYVQNVLVRALTLGAPVWHAIVEEAFPEEAARDPMVFYDARGSRRRFEENQRRMMESCSSFIDFDSLESYPMSRYRVAGAAEPGAGGEGGT